MGHSDLEAIGFKVYFFAFAGDFFLGFFSSFHVNRQHKVD
jgi:hypothetical protein